MCEKFAKFFSIVLNISMRSINCKSFTSDMNLICAIYYQDDMKEKSLTGKERREKFQYVVNSSNSWHKLM